jgi:hypothetical protein
LWATGAVSSSVASSSPANPELIEDDVDGTRASQPLAHPRQVGELTSGPRRAGSRLRPTPAESTTELEARLDGLLARPAIRHHENRKLLAHLRRERAHLFTFLSELGIPATNWRGEQALRPAVVNRKVWGGNRDLSGARTQEMVGSVVRTCRQQARDPHAVITALLRSTVSMVAPLLPLDRLPSGR